MMFRIVASALAVSIASAELRGDGSKRRQSLIVQEQAAEQQLTICNAYTSRTPLEIVRVRTRERLNNGNPLAYKQCAKLLVPLEEGDQLDFKAGHLDVGTFYATGVPKFQSSLVLVAHRRNFNAVGLSFESHAFSEVSNPQIAIIDAYRGKGVGSVKISESKPADDKNGVLMQVEDDLKFNSVVAVNPGPYEIALVGDKTGESEKLSNIPLATGPKGKYIVMRVGNDASASSVDHYPQELVVFGSGAFSSTSLRLIAGLLALTISRAFF
mmetsp:Transcript_33625/g.53482  ORF Transcript_33625/g.53482 Transcript_33625/m.53482 type:complete len:269 (+) Transcript_33625:65-871(+)